MVLDGFVARIREVFETVIVGRGLSTAALGQYRYGRRIAMLPGVAIVEICSYVLFPAFSRIAGDPDRLRRAFLRALGWIWFASVPAAFLLVALGEPIVVVLLGERWRAAGVLLVAMAGYGLGEAMNSVSAEAMKGAGRSDRLNWMTAANFVLGLGLLLLLLPLGLVGVGLAVTVTSVLVGGTGLWLARPVVGVTVREIARELVPPVGSALVALSVVGPLEHRLVHSDQRPIPAALGLLAAESVAFALVYLASICVVAPDRIGILRSGLRSLLTRCRQHAETGAVVPDHNPAAPLTPAPYLGPTADPGARNVTTSSPDLRDRRTRSSAGGAAGRREGPNEHRTEQ
jgi:PST family polysaccharide transporter